MKSGVLTIITGPMWSGKTTELLHQYDIKRRAGLDCVLVKHGIDKRYSEDNITTHNNSYGTYTASSATVYSSIQEIIQFVEEIGPIDSVFIDEIQFFPDIPLCIDLLNSGVNVTVAGLNSDFRRNIFKGMETLFALASDIKLLKSVCGFCLSQDACYSARKSNSSISDDVTDVIDVGGEEKYVAACPTCYLVKLNAAII